MAICFHGNEKVTRNLGGILSLYVLALYRPVSLASGSILLVLRPRPQETEQAELLGCREAGVGVVAWGM